MKLLHLLSFSLLLLGLTACAQNASNTDESDSTATDSEQEMQAEATQTSEIIQLNSANIEKILTDKENVIFFDVRTPGEVAEGKIPGAIVSDYNAGGFEEFLDSLDKSHTYIVYCASGNRSGEASKMMAKRGFTSIYNLEDGYSGWLETGGTRE